jgi:hypothetical protein
MACLVGDRLCGCHMKTDKWAIQNVERPVLLEAGYGIVIWRLTRGYANLFVAGYAVAMWRLTSGLYTKLRGLFCWRQAMRLSYGNWKVGYTKRSAACFDGGRLWSCHMETEKLDIQNVVRPVLLAIGYEVVIWRVTTELCTFVGCRLRGLFTRWMTRELHKSWRDLGDVTMKT